MRVLGAIGSSYSRLSFLVGVRSDEIAVEDLPVDIDISSFHVDIAL
jgi:hypothetical protein